MALNAAAHHSTEKVAAGEECSGLRAQTTFSAGRPGVLTELEPQGRAVTVGYVAAPVPLLAVPLLAGAAGEAVYARTLRAVACREGGRAEEGGVHSAGGRVAPGVLARARELYGSKRKRKKRRKKKTLRTSSSFGRAHRRRGMFMAGYAGSVFLQCLLHLSAGLCCQASWTLWTSIVVVSCWEGPGIQGLVNGFLPLVSCRLSLSMWVGG